MSATATAMAPHPDTLRRRKRSPSPNGVEDLNKKLQKHNWFKDIDHLELNPLFLLELPGVVRDSIDVKATDRSLSVSAERQPLQPEASEEAADSAETALLSEFRYGTWSRSFRFAQGLNREAITANYRDGVLEITAGKTQSHTSVTVAVDA